MAAAVLTAPQWPQGCDIGNYPQFIIFKGLFMQGAYCLNDTTLTSWIDQNADSIAGLADLGFQWDANGSQAVVNVGTVTSALDGLEAGAGNSTSM